MNKCRCKRSINPFLKDRKVKDDGYLKGEVMGDEETKVEQLYVEFELVSIPEVATAIEEATAGDSYERWVVRVLIASCCLLVNKLSHYIGLSYTPH